MKIERFSCGPLTLGKIKVSDELSFEEALRPLLTEEEIQASLKFKHTLRRREFLSGRAILHFLNPELPSVLIAQGGQPLWPDSMTGSITHKSGYVCASVVSMLKYKAVGIDLEEVSHFPKRVADIISTEEEVHSVQNYFHEEGFALAFIFSIKETLFKTCYPLCRIWFGFHDAKFLSCNLKTNTFKIQILKDLADHFKKGDIFEGHFQDLFLDQRRFVLTLLHL